MTTLLSLFKSNVYQLLIAAALVVAAFFAGATWNNNRATETAVTAVQAAADKRADQDRKDYAASIAKLKSDYGADLKQALAADQKSHAILAGERDRARADYERAMAALKQENSNVAKPDLVIGDASLRLLFDETSGACPAADAGSAKADVSGRVDGSSGGCGSSASLRLGELEAGYMALGRRLRDANAHVYALQAQASLLGLAPQIEGVKP